MIGAFTIPIGDLIHKLRKEREEETAAIEYVNNELAKILKGEGIMQYSIQKNDEEEEKDELEDLSLVQQQLVKER